MQNSSVNPLEMHLLYSCIFKTFASTFKDSPEELIKDKSPVRNAELFEFSFGASLGIKGPQ